VNRKLTFTEVCSWLREQARSFERMAADIENTFGTMPNHAAHGARHAATATGADAVAAIKQLMGDGSLRRATITEYLGIEESRLDGILTEENGFVRGSRGWWSVRNGEINDGNDEGGP